MANAVYRFDVTSPDVYMTSAGLWETSNEGYYYAIIPLEAGKSYKVALQNVTTLSRFRSAQADSAEIGVAELLFVSFTDSPRNGYSYSFVAEKDYLICYGGSAGGGEVLLTWTGVEYGDPMYIAYSSSADWGSTRIDTLDELIKITPAIFDAAPTGADLRALPDECRVEMINTGAYFFCINSDRYGRSIACPGYTLEPFYLASDATCSFYGNGFITGSLGNFEQYKYLYVYKQPDGRGFRLARCNTYVYLPENAWSDIESYAVEKITPGDYVPFKSKEDPVIPGKPASYSAVVYNGSTIATLKGGQKAVIKAAEYEFDHSIEFEAGDGGGGENISSPIAIKSGVCPVISVHVPVEKAVINIEGTGEITE